MVFTQRVKAFFSLLGVWILCIVIGSFAFQAVEGDVEYREYQLTFHDGFFFVFQLITTIGYGNITPRTAGGRVFAVLYALFGIPLTLLFVKVIGEGILNGQRFIITAVECHCLKNPGPPKWLNAKCFLLAFLSFLAMVIFGGAIHVLSESWKFGEATYFTFISYTTVGFGDLYPEKQPVLSAVSVFLGINVLSALIQAGIQLPFIVMFFKPAIPPNTASDTVDKEGYNDARTEV